MAGEVPLWRFDTKAPRIRPGRIVVGKVRQAESLDLLIALNSGLPRIISSVIRICRVGAWKRQVLSNTPGTKPSA